MATKLTGVEESRMTSCNTWTWSKIDLDYLIVNYAKMSSEGLVNNLNRTWNAIRNKASRLGLIKEFAEEHKRKISESHKGKKRTGETKKKISETMKNHFVSNETKKKISIAMKGKYLGDKHHAWNGGMIYQHGYIYRYSPNHPFKNHNCYVSEHRLVLEKRLGRYLNPVEVVHHKNGIKDDNRIENLQLFESNGAHLSYELVGKKFPINEYPNYGFRNKEFSKQHKLNLSKSVKKAWDEGRLNRGRL